MEQAVGPGLMRGRDAAGAWVEDSLSTFDDVHFEIEELIERDDRVVAVVRWKGRGRQSGAPSEMRFAQLITLRNGLLLRIMDYRDPAKALEAAGLRQ